MTLAAGFYGLTLEKFLNLGLSSYASGMESETLNKVFLTTDTYTPNFDTHDFRNDANANEPGNSGTYAAGGSILTTTELTPASPAATQLKYTAVDVSWTTATLTARGTVTYHVVGTAATDEVLFVNSFGGDVSTVAGTFTVSWHATNGLLYFDYA